jgi:hypothetical protein
MASRVGKIVKDGLQKETVGTGRGLIIPEICTGAEENQGTH